MVFFIQHSGGEFEKKKFEREKKQTHHLLLLYSYVMCEFCLKLDHIQIVLQFMYLVFCTSINAILYMHL